MEYNNLINELLNLCDENIDIIAIKKIKKELLNDEKLKEDLDNYRLLPTVSNKKKLYNYPLYKEFLKRETNINFLIMDINKQFDTLKKKVCFHENN